MVETDDVYRRRSPQVQPTGATPEELGSGRQFRTMTAPSRGESTRERPFERFHLRPSGEPARRRAPRWRTRRRVRGSPRSCCGPWPAWAYDGRVDPRNLKHHRDDDESPKNLHRAGRDRRDDGQERRSQHMDARDTAVRRPFPLGGHHGRTRSRRQYLARGQSRRVGSGTGGECRGGRDEAGPAVCYPADGERVRPGRSATAPAIGESRGHGWLESVRRAHEKLSSTPRCVRMVGSRPPNNAGRSDGSRPLAGAEQGGTQ